MNKDEFKQLNAGDIVKGKMSNLNFIVTGNYGDRVTAVNNVDLTNHSEWDLISKALRENEIIKLKKIDMSVCIESGIDCEFSEDGFEQPVENQYYDKTVYCIDKLFNIGGRESEHRHISMIHGTNNWFEYCRPRMNHTHSSPTMWDKCPLPEGFIITTWLDGCSEVGVEGQKEYSSNVWSRIHMFQVTGIAEGYEL